jgi:hypothetical protein
MKINLNNATKQGLKTLKAHPRQNAIHFTTEQERQAYAMDKHRTALTNGERYEMLALYMLDVITYYPTQDGKQVGDLHLRDGSKVQVKGNGGQLGRSKGVALDQLTRAYKAIEQDASDYYLLVADTEKGFALVTKQQLADKVDELLKDSESLRLTINEKRLRLAFPYDYQRV